LPRKLGVYAPNSLPAGFENPRRKMPVFIGFPAAPPAENQWRTSGAKSFAPPPPAPTYK
jgi:hypothetical protein